MTSPRRATRSRCGKACARGPSRSRRRPRTMRRGVRGCSTKNRKADMGNRKYFGTDGIRGHVGESPISADFMLKLGRAAGHVLARAGGDGSILIGKDTRLSGYMFEAALEAGLIAAGARVRLLGPMPTPAV